MACAETSDFSMGDAASTVRWEGVNDNPNSVLGSVNFPTDPTDPTTRSFIEEDADVNVMNLIRIKMIE